MKVGIVYPVINQFKMAIQAIESVKTIHTWTPFIIPQWRHTKPLSEAWNIGITQAVEAKCDYILVSNDDVLYSPWAIDALVEELRISSTTVVMATGCNQRGSFLIPELIKEMSQPNPEEVTKAESPDFACFMVRRNFFDLVGTFDENIHPAYYEDNEMHIRINSLGFRAICTTAAPYYHYGSASQNADLGNNRPLVDGNKFSLNGRYVTEKWGSTDASSPNLFKWPFNNPENDAKIWKREWRSY